MFARETAFPCVQGERASASGLEATPWEWFSLIETVISRAERKLYRIGISNSSYCEV